MKLTRRHLNKLAKYDNLHLQVKSKFNGMIDGTDFVKEPFTPVTYNDTKKGSYLYDVTLGIEGVWSIKGRDLLEAYDDGQYRGIYVYNSCGSFILAEKY